MSAPTLTQRVAALEARIAVLEGRTVVAAESPIEQAPTYVGKPHVSCSLHPARRFAVGTDPTKGILFHRGWCKGTDVAV